MRTSVNLLSALALGAGLIGAACGAAGAVGALAFGSTGDIAKDGYSIGINASSANEEDAKKSAMNWCTTHGPKQTQEQCKILVLYRNQCVAEAQDPKAGTPGFGFGLADSEEDAKTLAMAICQASSGKGRQQFCKVTATLCDK